MDNERERDPAGSDDSSGADTSVHDATPAPSPDRATAAEAGARPGRVRLRWWTAGLAVVLLLAGAGLYLALRGSAPEDVVTAYLNALRAGDVDTALTYTDEDSGDDLSAADSARGFLAGDTEDEWSFGQVIRRGSGDHHTGEPDFPRTTVDATLTGADGATAQNRFELIKFNGEWTIDNPLIELDLSKLPLDFVEFNGVTADTAKPVTLFPGVYRGFTDSAALFSTGVAEYVAVSESESGEPGGAAILRAADHSDREVRRGVERRNRRLDG